MEATRAKGVEQEQSDTGTLTEKAKQSPGTCATVSLSSSQVGKVVYTKQKDICTKVRRTGRRMDRECLEVKEA